MNQPAESIAPLVSSGGGRPKRYKLASGIVVPGVTTIAGAYKDPGPLMHWAHRLGLEGKDYREERDKAGEAGSIVHDWIEADIHGLAPSDGVIVADSETLKAAKQGFAAYLEWRAMVHMQVVDTERPLVSELHAFGGTYDAVALINGVPMLLDWKSGGGVYPEVIAQLAAYRQLIRESVGSRRDGAPEAACCLRVGKEFADFHYHLYPKEVMDLGWDRFQAAKWMYTIDKSLKKVCQ